MIEVTIYPKTVSNELLRAINEFFPEKFDEIPPIQEMMIYVYERNAISVKGAGILYGRFKTLDVDAFIKHITRLECGDIGIIIKRDGEFMHFKIENVVD